MILLWLTSHITHCCSLREKQHRPTRWRLQSGSRKVCDEQLGSNRECKAPRMLSPEGPFTCDSAKKVVIFFPQCCFLTQSNVGQQWKALGEIHNWMLQPRHWWRLLISNFYTFLSPTFPPCCYLNREQLYALYFLSYRGGKEAANQLSNRQRGSVSSRLVPEVF